MTYCRLNNTIVVSKNTHTYPLFWTKLCVVFKGFFRRRLRFSRDPFVYNAWDIETRGLNLYNAKDSLLSVFTVVHERRKFQKTFPKWHESTMLMSQELV